MINKLEEDDERILLILLLRQ